MAAKILSNIEALDVYPPSLRAHQFTNILIIVTSAVIYQVFITLK